MGAHGPNIPADGPPRGASRRGFTLIELLVVIVIIFLLAGILLVAFGAARRAARGAAERQDVAGLKVAVEQFRSDMGFIPPLLKDFNPEFQTGDVPRASGVPAQPLYDITTARPGVNAFDFSLAARNEADRDYLRGDGLDRAALDPAGVPDLRFSTYALAWYIAGALPTSFNDGGTQRPVDGLEGAGTSKVTRAGGFEANKGRFGPYFDVGSNPDRIAIINASEGRVELRGASGTPYRFYRWLPGLEGETRLVLEPGRELEQLNIPALVGDPSANPALRDAEYAIVAAGPDGGFGDLGTEEVGALASRIGRQNLEADPAELAQTARADNVVEVGK